MLLRKLGSVYKTTTRAVLFPRKPVRLFSKTTKRKNRLWQQEFARDPFVKKAREMDYRTRSAFKLIEIDSRYKFIRKSKKILELGCFPGGWTQVLQEQAPYESTIVAVDILKTKKLITRNGVQVNFLEGDVFKENTKIEISKALGQGQADLVVSDMSPSFKGDLDLDHIEISEMNVRTLDFCETFAKIGATVLLKTLQGTDEKKTFEFCNLYFNKIHRIKPSASRAKSSELYYLGLGFKQNEFWHQVGQIPEKERTFERIYALLPENLKKNGEVLENLKQNLKENIMLEKIKEDDLTTEREKTFFREVSQEMKKENYSEKNKRDPIYSIDDLHKSYNDFCEQNNYRYSFMKFIPKTYSEMVDKYEEQRPQINQEMQDMVGHDCTFPISISQRTPMLCGITWSDENLNNIIWKSTKIQKHINIFPIHHCDLESKLDSQS